MALDIKKFEKGKCFICGKETEGDTYAHSYCCEAYSDEKAKRIKENGK